MELSVQECKDTLVSGCSGTDEESSILTDPGSGTAGDTWKDNIACETNGASNISETHAMFSFSAGIKAQSKIRNDALLPVLEAFCG